MSESSRCCFVVEARLLRNGSACWDPRQSFPKGHWVESLQVFGGIAFTWEHDLHLYLRRAAVLVALLGEKSAYREVVADHLDANG